MNHRLFIAINLPERIKKELKKIQEKNESLPAKWTREENLHITLSFLGNVSSQDIMEICNKVSDISFKTKSFLIRLNEISYGPGEKLPPRMLWAKGQKNKEMGKLQQKIEEAILGFPQKERREFSPHITLARIKTWQWSQINPEERPEVKEDINLEFEVESIDVMESFLKREGPRYEILESFQLKE